MFFILDALKIVKRNSIQRTLNAYFTECYPFSIKQLNVSNRSISPSQVILGFVSFRSFHRISILVSSSDPFQLRPTFTWIYLKQPFSQNLGLAYSSFKPQFPFSDDLDKFIRFPFSLQQSNILEINRYDFKLFEVDSKLSADALNIGE